MSLMNIMLTNVRDIYCAQDGVVDSIRSLLNNYNQHSKHLVKLLLSPLQKKYVVNHFDSETTFYD